MKPNQQSKQSDVQYKTIFRTQQVRFFRKSSPTSALRAECQRGLRSLWGIFDCRLRQKENSCAVQNRDQSETWRIRAKQAGSRLDFDFKWSRNDSSKGDRVANRFKLQLLLHEGVVQLVEPSREEARRDWLRVFYLFFSSFFACVSVFSVWVLRSDRRLQRLGRLHPSILQLPLPREMRECLWPSYARKDTHARLRTEVWMTSLGLSPSLRRRMRKATGEQHCVLDHFFFVSLLSDSSCFPPN